jgi:glutathione-regulated potassium-efflux system ancillary protein KefF
MLEQVRTLENVEIRSLYQLYPDFNIDIAAEQEALSRADLIVWQHPMQWYSTPPLLKLWIDKVFSHGWAYGHNGNALKGKSLMWAVTTGGGKATLILVPSRGLRFWHSRCRRPHFIAG